MVKWPLQRWNDLQLAIKRLIWNSCLIFFFAWISRVTSQKRSQLNTLVLDEPQLKNMWPSHWVIWPKKGKNDFWNPGNRKIEAKQWLVFQLVLNLERTIFSFISLWCFASHCFFDQQKKTSLARKLELLTMQPVNSVYPGSFLTSNPNNAHIFFGNMSQELP